MASGPTHGHVNETLMNKSKREVNLETRIGVHVPRSCRKDEVVGDVDAGSARRAARPLRDSL